MKLRKGWLIGLATALLLGSGLGLAISQPAAPFYFALAPTGLQQNTLRVNPAFSPHRVEGGCESERIGSGAVNGYRLSGGTAGNPVTITAFPCATGDANVGISLIPAGTGGVTMTGTGTIRTHSTFFSAIDNCRSDNALLVPLRVAAGDFALARTAAGAETYNVSCSFPLPYQLVANKGVRLDSIAISYQVLVVNLTTHTFSDIRTRTFANNVANALAAYGGGTTITLNTVVQANPYFTTGTPAAAVFMNTANTEVNVEWQAVLANTGQYRVYGVQLNWSQAIF